MEFKFIVGVDMSKNWFNYCVMDKNLKIITEGQVDNTPDKIFLLIMELGKVLKIKKLSELILCLEHTGIYVQHLVRCWLSKGGRLTLVPSVKISKLLTGQPAYEEKTDILDAQRIAEYGVRFSDKLKLWQAKPHTLELLQALHRQRERLLKAMVLLEVPAGESREFDSIFVSNQIEENQASSLKAIRDDLKTVEQQLVQLIAEDEDLGVLFERITSVEGIGPVTAREIIIATVAFTKFTPSQAKMFARYCGLVPLKKSSGKFVRKQNTTGNRTNKKVKELLTMGARSLAHRNTELGVYYRRKKAEGKQHLVVINAMRNKMIHRIFAVVRNQVMYQKNLNVCLE